MRNLRQIVPSPSALIAFEAAGRHNSFTKAGAELGMSQAAVSLAVRGLEDSLSVTLFRREHRRVVLTEAGARFHSDVALGLGHISKSAEELRALSNETHVTLQTSTAFASLWMLPRLARFREDLPDIDLRIQTTDRDLDFRLENVALGVRLASSDGVQEFNSAILALERIEAIASPAYVDLHGLPDRNEAITRHRLIHLEEPYRPCPDWTEWLRSIGLARPPLASGLLINDYVLVVQAVMQGQGIALGWKHLTDRLVDSGMLVRVGDHILETGSAFHLLWSKERPLSAPARLVKDWLIDQAATR
jgi:DNA-binding transcriptional LysR family regulator